MALKGLLLEEMVAISGSWVNQENPARVAIQGVGRLAGMLPDLERAHAAIYAVTPKTDPRKAEVARLAVEEDGVHDGLASGIYGLLTELARLDEQGSELLTLRNTLMPEGLAKVVNVSYRGEAGFAGLLRERLTPALRAQLASVPLRQGNLLQRVEAWLDSAARLGALEEERARFEDGTSPSLAKQVVEARLTWIRVVNAFQSVAALAELDGAHDRIVFGPLRDAESKADQRAARRKGPAVSTPSVEARLE